MTLSEEIASVAHAVVFSRIPSHTVDRTKLFLIDTLGTALAGKIIGLNPEAFTSALGTLTVMLRGPGRGDWRGY